MSSFERDFYKPNDAYFAAEDLDFQSGDSPAVLDITTSLQEGGKDGRILCKSTTGSTGRILVEISHDGSNYGDQFSVFHLETFPLFGYKVKKLRITHSGTDSGYRVVVR